MTTDLLIERLRLAANNRVVVGHTKRSLCADAADEIELLRAALSAERKRCCGIVIGLAGSDNVAQRTVDAIRGETP